MSWLTRNPVLTAIAAVLAAFAAPRAMANPWAHLYSGSGAHELKDAVPTADGGLLAVGWTSMGAFGSRDGWILKVDASGEIEWQEAVAGSGTDGFSRVRASPLGGWVAMLGSTVVRLGDDGSLTWALSGAGAASIADAAPLATGEILAVGTIASGITFAGWLVVLGDDGQVVSQQAFGDPDITSPSFASVAPSPAGGAYVACLTSTLSGLRADIVRLDDGLQVAGVARLASMGDCGGVHEVVATRDGGVLFEWLSCAAATINISEWGKLRQDGSCDWRVDYSDRTSFTTTRAETTDNGTVAVVSHLDASGSCQYELHKITSAGTPDWVDDGGSGRPVALPDGDIALVGKSGSAARIVRLDSFGRADGVACADLAPGIQPLVVQSCSGGGFTGSLTPWALTGAVTAVTLTVSPTLAVAACGPREPSALDLLPAATPLRVVKATGGQLLVSWEDVGTPEYSLYRGTIAALVAGRYDHAGFGHCGLVATSEPIADEQGDFYFVVASHSGSLDSSLGRKSTGAERLCATSACP